MVHAISSAAECQQLLETKPLVMLKFSATWCAPCKAVAPAIDSLATKFPTVFIGDVDIDKCQDVAAQYGISAVPSFVFFKQGKQLETVKGGDIAKVTVLLRDLAASAPSHGKANRLGGASSTEATSSARPSMAELRELRTRALANAPKDKVDIKEEPKATVKSASRKHVALANWSIAGFLTALYGFIVLYFGTLFSLDARSSAQKLAANQQ